MGGFIVAGKALPSPIVGTDTPPNSSDVASSYSVAGESIRFYIFVPGLLPLRERKKSHAIIAPVAGRRGGGAEGGEMLKIPPRGQTNMSCPLAVHLRFDAHVIKPSPGGAICVSSARQVGKSPEGLIRPRDHSLVTTPSPPHPLTTQPLFLGL